MSRPEHQTCNAWGSIATNWTTIWGGMMFRHIFLLSHNFFTHH